MNHIYTFILGVLTLLALYYMFETDEYCERSLGKDGYCVLQDNNYLTSIHKLHTDVLDKLPHGYEFIDYEYKINDVALSTFHRDVTSSQRIHHTKYPVYTVILYKYGGELLSVCPRSHRQYPFVLSRIVNLQGTAGTAFLFDCDLLHAGRVNHCKKREVIQFKVCHHDDLPKLKCLVGTHIEKNGKCTISNYDKVLRKLSYFGQFPINTIFYPLMIKRETTNSIITRRIFFIFF